MRVESQVKEQWPSALGESKNSRRAWTIGEAEIERLDNEGIITPTNWSKCATPVVAIPKADGTVRLLATTRLIQQ